MLRRDGTRGLVSGLRAASGEGVKESPSDTGATSKKKTTSSFRNFLVPSTPVAARRRMTTPVVNTHPRHRSNLQEKTKTNPPRAVHSRGGTAPNDHSRGQHTPPTPEQSSKKTTSSFQTSFRVSGMKISGISAARRGIPPELRLRWRRSRRILSHHLPQQAPGIRNFAL